jgi:hypothetical protein
MEENQAEQVHKSSSRNLVILIAVLVAVALIIIVFMYERSKRPIDSQTITKENVIVERFNVTGSSGASKLPSGFPDNIPVEIAGISESLSMNYVEKDSILYNVEYFSQKSVLEKYTEYLKFVQDNNYTLISNNQSSILSNIYARSNNSDLSVVVNLRDNRTLIGITYVKR